MATTQFPDLHTQAGAKWLAPFLAILWLAVAMAFVMLIYPYVSH